MDNKTLGILAVVGAAAVALFAFKKNAAPSQITVQGPNGPVVFPYSPGGGIPYGATAPLNGGLGLPDVLVSRNDDNVTISQGNCTEYYTFGVRHVVCNG